MFNGDPIPLPFAVPDLAIAYTCPLCGHRNRLEAVPKELDQESRDEYREQFGPDSCPTDVVGAPCSHECEKCKQDITLGNPWAEDEEEDQ